MIFMQKDVKVGVGVFILNSKNEILFGKRKGSHGEGTWSLPGGHLEFGEEIITCAKREVKEETDLDINEIEILTITNDIFEKEAKHYITIFVKAKSFSGELKIMEPNKCAEWKWFEWKNLPSELFLPIINLKKSDFNL